MNKIEPLPMPWVDRIFSKLTMRYGRDFLSRYEGIDLHLVKSNWAEELAGLQNRPEAIKYALDYPSTKAPNVVEFKEMCSRAPTKPMLGLAAPVADKAVIDRATAMAQEAFRPGDPLETLRALAESDARDGTYNGRKVTMAQRQTYRQALGMEGKQA